MPSAQTKPEEIDVMLSIPDPNLVWSNPPIKPEDRIEPYYEDNRKYRSIYYTILSGEFADLVEGYMKWEADFEESINTSEFPEMMLVTFVKSFGIPKEKFEEAIRNYMNHNIKYDIDMTFAPFEPPNADIIYTFDNKIINAYYRWKNPVEPDWSKTKTYDSYEAYLKAQVGK